MQIALIPPLPDLPLAELGDMHLALNHLCVGREYKNYYKGRAESGDFVILDNSAHEFQQGTRIEDLLVNAIAIQAREIVIPDVLFHAMMTVERARESLQFLRESELFRACSPTPRLMLVPQGRDWQDIQWCLDQLLKAAEANDFLELVTIGLSKDYASYTGGLQLFLDKMMRPVYDQHKIQTHLLGWSCTWDLVEMSRNYPFIRSTDSAKPFIYAMKGITLRAPLKPPVIHRPENYFYEPIRNEHKQTVLRNVSQFKLASRGIRATPRGAVVG